jgi:hypothetical protein
MRGRQVNVDHLLRHHLAFNARATVSGRLWSFQIQYGDYEKVGQSTPSDQASKRGSAQSFMTTWWVLGMLNMSSCMTRQSVCSTKLNVINVTYVYNALTV